MIKPIRWLFLAAFMLPALALAQSPSIVMKDLAGRKHNVNEYIGHGKWTVVMVWAHDCSVCNADVDQMTFFHDAHHKKDATVLGISIDGYHNRRLAQNFIDDHQVDFPNLITVADPRIFAKFGGGPFVGTPTFYIYAPDGTLAAAQVGPVTEEEVEDFMRSHPELAARKSVTHS